jgi:hypothetical protein
VTTVFEPAAEARVTVHTALPVALKEFGEQLKPVNPTGADPTRVMFADRLTPFRVPVTVAVVPVVIVPAVTVNWALVCPFWILTLPGVVNWAVLSSKVTEVAPTAALVNVAVHDVL